MAKYNNKWPTGLLAWFITDFLIALLDVQPPYQINDIKMLKEKVFSVALRKNVEKKIQILKDSAAKERDDDIRN